MRIALLAASVAITLSGAASADPFKDAHAACLERDSNACIAIMDEGITVARIAEAWGSPVERIITLNNWEGQVYPDSIIPVDTRFRIGEGRT